MPSWADAGSPHYLSAARHVSGEFRLCGLSAGGEILFSLPMPDRGHAAAAHPVRPEAVAFARRPGTFALVLDCARGHVRAELDAAPGRHFYGHGVYSQDGSRLFTTENDLETLQGRIGIWDTARYARIGEISSAGIGPHDLRRLPGSEVLVVANGGIETHPDSGRAKLNLPTMRSNLAFVAPDGALLDRFDMPEEMQLSSLRHLAVGDDGLVAAAMQWQGDPIDAPPLLALYRQDGSAAFLAADLATHRRFEGYAGSVALSGDQSQAAITSPRGGIMAAFDVQTGEQAEIVQAPDICGLAPGRDGFVYTSGQGLVGWTSAFEAMRPVLHASHSFDNHLIAL
ncbi:MAG: DUF1513 domain-containing protein [Pseudomonadota bacterium]